MWEGGGVIGYVIISVMVSYTHEAGGGNIRCVVGIGGWAGIERMGGIDGKHYYQ